MDDAADSGAALTGLRRGSRLRFGSRARKLQFGAARGGRAGWAAVTLAGLLTCCVVLTAAATSWVDHRAGRVVGPADFSPTRDIGVPDPSESPTRVAVAQDLLDRRADAVRTGRRVDWGLTLDPSPAHRTFRERQLAEFDRVRLLPVRRWDYELLETRQLPGLPGDQTFLARARLQYRFTGDSRDVERIQQITVARSEAGWAITSIVGQGRGTDPWELGPVAVQTGRRSVVVQIGNGRSQDLRALVRAVDEAAAHVDGVWGTAWARTVVVVAPQQGEQFAALLGWDDAPGLDQLAAVTSGELARDPGAGGGLANRVDLNRVVLNPDVFDRLTPLGRKVVLAHELTHVATRAYAQVSPPPWVEEGFANYVAYRGSGLAPRTIAADVLPLVRAGTASTVLPTAADFDPLSGSSISSAYADAWMAFELMARDGEGRPLDFYRAVARPAAAGAGAETAVREAFRTVLGTNRRDFETRWLGHRAALAEDESG